MVKLVLAYRKPCKFTNGYSGYDALYTTYNFTSVSSNLYYTVSPLSIRNHPVSTLWSVTSNDHWYTSRPVLSTLNYGFNTTTLLDPADYSRLGLSDPLNTFYLNPSGAPLTTTQLQPSYYINQGFNEPEWYHH